ncbi:MlaD family protein [Gordonia effusa]|uniref:MlaD family protein n=1 Tax=Gordonia effusa TaxID=263908 RepID=UPI0014783D20|nr:MlaD family protein [Gordonia effusa]
MIGAVSIVAVLLICALVYVIPFDKRTYHALVSDASWLRAGDEVRIAGVGVGKVTAITLNTNDVDVAFTVKSDVRLGSETSAAARMLTAVGGYYLAVQPAGSGALSSPIPANRVALPYSLIQLFGDASAKIPKLELAPVGQSLATLNDALKEQPKALRDTITASANITHVLAQQNSALDDALNVADEYIAFVNGNKQTMLRFLRVLAQLEGIVRANADEIVNGVGVADELISRIGALAPIYTDQLEPIAASLAKSTPAVNEMLTKVTPMVARLSSLITRIKNMYAKDGFRIDQSNMVLASDICIPLPGKSC